MDIIKLLEEGISISPNNYQIYEDAVNQFQWERKKSFKNKLGLDVIVFSDTHGSLTDIKRFEDFLYHNARYDCCLLLGDLSRQDMDILLSYIPYWKIFGILGNHDQPDQLRGLTNLHAECVEVKNVKIAGIEGCNRYKEGDSFPMMTQIESLKVSIDMMNKFPPADILISHDMAFMQLEYDTAHTGLLGITSYLNCVNPSHHLHGHVHNTYTRRYKNGTFEHSIWGAQFLAL